MSDEPSRPRALALMTTIIGATVILAAVVGIASAEDTAQNGSPPILREQAIRPKPAPSQAASPAAGSIALELPRHLETDPKAVESILDTLVRTALSRNPDLAAASSEHDAAVAHIPIAGTPPDPLIGFRLKDMPTTFSFTRENATEKQIEFAQAYPFPGKLGLREDIARGDAEVIRARFHAARVELVSDVRTTFADLFAADKEIEVAIERRKMLKELAAIATNKYRVGPGLQQDVLNADVAVARIDTKLIELGRKRITRELRLAQLLDQESLHVPPLGTLPPSGLAHSTPELQEMALAANPEVEERARALARDTKAVELAYRSPLPDFQIGGTYGSRVDHPPPAPVTALSRPDMIGFSVMATVPVFYMSKQRQEVAEAQARLARSRSKLAAARRRTIEGLLELLARYDQHDRVARSFEQHVIPLARSEVAAAMSAYQVDKVDFLTMLAAQDNLDNYEAEFWQNEADRFADLARIDAMTGAILVEGAWNK